MSDLICSNHDGLALLCQLQIRPAIALEGELCGRVLGNDELGHVLALTSEGITHAITIVRSLWEADLSISLGNLLGWALDVRRGNLDVLVKVDSAIARELEHHVQDERDRSVKLASKRVSHCKCLLAHLQIWVAIALE